MYHAFVRKCKVRGGVDFFAHMVDNDSLPVARKRVEADTSSGEVEEVIEIGSSMDSDVLYEKACKKANKLSTEKGVKPLPMKEKAEEKVEARKPVLAQDDSTTFE
jgi:hypothetical protein